MPSPTSTRMWTRDTSPRLVRVACDDHRRNGDAHHVLLRLVVGGVLSPRPQAGPRLRRSALARAAFHWSCPDQAAADSGPPSNRDAFTLMIVSNKITGTHRRISQVVAMNGMAPRYGNEASRNTHIPVTFGLLENSNSTMPARKAMPTNARMPIWVETSYPVGKIMVSNTGLSYPNAIRSPRYVATKQAVSQTRVR